MQDRHRRGDELRCVTFSLHQARVHLGSHIGFHFSKRSVNFCNMIQVKLRRGRHGPRNRRRHQRRRVRRPIRLFIARRDVFQQSQECVGI